MSRSKRWWAVLAATAMVAAACGSSQDNFDGGETVDGGVEPTVAPLGVDVGSEPTLERAPVDAEAPITATAAGLNNVGFELLRTQPADENLVFSPASIGHTLLMALPAADDATAVAIRELIPVPAGDAAHNAWNAIDAGFPSDGPVKVTVSDRIWPDTGANPDQEWVDLLATRHGVDAVTLPLHAQPGASRDAINKWVGDRTEGLIPELLPAGFIQPSTVLVLTDTVYFEAEWKLMFGKYGPETANFTRLDGTTVSTEFMVEREQSDARGGGDGYVGAELPYAGDQFSMLLIVPDDGRFGEVRDRLGPEFLDEIDASFTTGAYELVMPKWDDNTQIDLLGFLRETGVAPGAFPAIGPGVFLDAAVHAADISVDEMGTVAAAATAFGFNESGSPEPELAVRADRPFLYLIRHRESGLILFMGQVTDPTT